MKYLLYTLGCKVNQYESQQIRMILGSFGLTPAQDGEPYDLAIVNTCAVTSTAARKTRQQIRRASRSGSIPTIVVGCYADTDSNTIRKIPGVIEAIGHHEVIYPSLRKVLEDKLGLTVLEDEAISETDPSHGPLLDRFTGHQRAFLKIQDGCDAWCSYCIIPKLRERIWSKPVDEVVCEARRLVEAGHKEIVLTGIFLGAYGRETARRHRSTKSESSLPELVEAVAKVDGLVRLRLSSLEPGDLDESLLSVLKQHDCCTPHLHLPLQSGSTRILKKMNRQYDADDYIRTIEKIQSTLELPALTTDVVVGFPSETEEDFEQTMHVARVAGFCKIHAFPFSPRPGTAAAIWQKEFVPSSIAKERMARLVELERETTRIYLAQFAGRVERVIVEKNDTEDWTDTQTRHGRSDRYFDVRFEAPHLTEGDIAKVEIEVAEPGNVTGHLVKENL